MRTLVASLIAASMLALPAFAADTAASGAKPTANRMDPAKGSFHRIHAKRLKLACDTCHDANAADPLQLGRARASQVSANREACLGCHQSPAKPTWYGPAP